MDCSLPGFSVHGNSQTGILEWVAITFLSEASMEFNKVFLLHRGVSLPYRAPCFYFRAEKKNVGKPFFRIQTMFLCSQVILLVKVV